MPKSILNEYLTTHIGKNNDHLDTQFADLAGNAFTSVVSASVLLGILRHLPEPLQRRLLDPATCSGRRRLNGKTKCEEAEELDDLEAVDDVLIS